MDSKIKSILTRLAPTGSRAQADSVNSLVVIGASLFIGIFVLASIGDAVPSAGMFSDAMNQTENVLSSSIELAAILPIVIIAAGLLFWVRRFNGGGRR